jgi:hypothetical protein
MIGAVLTRSSRSVALGLIGGYAVARYSRRRSVGGAVFAVAGALTVREWSRDSGPAAAAGLGALYAVAMGGSHPLARRIGAWPAVLAVTAGTVAASEVVSRRA